MISVQHNMLAENANRQLGINTKKNAKMAEKLSSGYRINRAADDAAGLAISEKMRRQVRGLGQAADNIKDGIGYVQTAEGALNEAQDILQRINQLSVQAANGTNTVSDRAYINSEVQALKAELSRIFSTTTFNEQRIWEPRKGVERVNLVEKNAVTFTGSASMADAGGATNENCGVLAAGSYRLEADDSGIQVKWTGYDSNAYSTEKVPWDEVAVDSNGVYSFNMEDYFGVKDGTNKLYAYNNGTGEYEPVLKKTVSFTVNPHATRQDVIDSINGSTMGSNPQAYMQVNNADCKNLYGTAQHSGDVYVNNVSLYYPAAYLSWANGNGNGFNFNEPDEDFIEPSSTTCNLIKDPIAENNGGGIWSFSFNMEGIGSVHADSTSISFFSNDGFLYKPEDKGVWWYYSSYYDKNFTQSISTSPGTLNALQNGLSGNRGLLHNQNGGSTDTGVGTATFTFTLIPNDQSLTYGNGQKLTSVGYFSVRAAVYQSDDEQAVIERVKKALNQSTVLDFTRSGDYASIYGLSGTSKKIDVPVHYIDYEAGPEYKDFWVQAGAEAGQHIDIEYESLSLWALGMQDTDTLTVESASRAIDEVKGALQIVSDQRSLFGAYQNRLEHAYNINKNVEENTQASESLIRDTDIADAMMEFSINNILLQAGTSMLTQANQSSQLITQLLG